MEKIEIGHFGEFRKPIFEIGQKFLDGDRVCTVTDILRTYNAKDELVSVKYVATHEFCGQVVTDRSV